MTYQLRDYTVKEGEMDEWIQEWRDVVLPMRKKFGFEVVGAWAAVDENRFVWIVGHDGDFAAVDAEYYNSDERKNVDPNPARHLATTQKTLMRRVL
jgi:hypothetical protein